MKLIGLCTVKNEGDIIYQCLKHSVKVYDVIFVTDNESWDDSRGEIQRASHDFQNVVYLGEVGDKVSKEVKWQIWETFRHCFGWSDWWGILDADEFVSTDLPGIVRTANNEYADHIFGVMANFYYTESEVQDWMEGRETLADRERPIQDRRRYYRMHTSQIRLFRNLPWIRWNENTNVPDNLSRRSSRPVVYKHYQYRDVPQVKLRVQTRSRSAVPSDHFEINPHWDRTDWREAISPDDDPYLRQNERGKPLEPCETLSGPPDPSSPVKGLLKYGRSIMRGALAPQRKAQLFSDLEPKAIVNKVQ